MKMDLSKQEFMARGNEFRRVFLPYCVSRIIEDENRWIILNREYKPLGFPVNGSDSWVDYKKFPHWAIEGLTEKKARKIHAGYINRKGEDSFNYHWPFRIYLYHDGCIPTDGKKYMDEYAKRLSLLMKLSVLQVPSEYQPAQSKTKIFPSLPENA